MAVTTNYSWVTPDDTALVKDGAAAIRTLGSSVDTTTKALNPSTTLGDIEYRSSTANTNTRLGIGTTGQILTVAGGVPSWAAAPSSGGMTLISTTTLTGASISLSSIPSTYNSLQIIIRNHLPASDGTGLCMRINGDSTASRHIYKENWDKFTDQSISATFMFVNDQVDNGTSTFGNIKIEIPDYANASNGTHILMNATANNMTTTSNLQIFNNIGYYNQTAAVSSIDFFNFSGNFTSGTVLLYGVK